MAYVRQNVRQKCACAEMWTRAEASAHVQKIRIFECARAQKLVCVHKGQCACAKVGVRERRLVCICRNELELEFECAHASKWTRIFKFEFKFKFRFKNIALICELCSDLKVSMSEDAMTLENTQCIQCTIKWDADSQCNLYILLWYMSFDKLSEARGTFCCFLLMKQWQKD
jgi:hypothetical protein